MNFFLHKFVQNSNKCYFMAMNFNRIYEVNLENNEVRFWGSIPGESVVAKRLFSDFICVGNKLFFVPDRASFIHVLDENAKEIRRLKLENKISEYFKSDLKFLKAILINDIIYIIPYAYPAMIMLNIYSYEIVYIDSFIKDCEIADNGLCAGMFMTAKCIKNEICLLHRSSNKIIFFNIESKKYQLISIGNETSIYVDICFDGYSYWIITATGELLKWHRERNEFEIIFDYETAELKQTIITGWNVIEKNIFHRSGYVWIFSYCYPAVRINIKNGQCEVMKEFESGIYEMPINKAGGYNHVCISMNGSGFNVFCQYRNMLFSYDFFSEHVKTIQLMSENEMHKEEFHAFLQGIMAGEYMISDVNKENIIGRKIFKYINYQI